MTEDDTKIERLSHWLLGETAAPWSVSLYPTNRCNLRCPICWQRNPGIAVDYTNELPDEAFLRLVDDGAAAGVREWFIMGSGEPMMRPELLLQLCTKIRAHGMIGHIQSNGCLFTRAHLEQLVDIQWNTLRISLDGPDEAINDRTRSRTSFARATENLKLLAGIKRERNSAAPAVMVYCVLTSLNCDKLDRMVDLAHEVGAEYIELSTMVLHAEEGRPFLLTDAQKAALPESLEKASARAKALGIHDNFAIYLDPEIAANPNDMHSRTAKPSGLLLDAPCFMPWLNMVVLFNGSAGPCCMYDDEFPEDSNNVAHRSLMEVWRGPYFTRLRDRMVQGRMPRYCATCPSTLFAEQDVLREAARGFEHESIQRQPLLRNAEWLLKKALNSVRKHGVRAAVRRGREWFLIHFSRKKASS